MNNNDKLVQLPKTHIHQGINFLNNLKEFSDAENNSKTFKFYHMYMPHAPFLLDKELNYRTDAHGFSAYQEYAIASLKLMGGYLSKLKSIGAYDNSAIIITADHGGGEYHDRSYDHKSGEYKKIPTIGRQVASGKPLLLVKEFSNNGPLSLSDKPLSLLDVAPTLGDFAGISIDTEGIPLKDIPDDSPRERTYFHYSFTSWSSAYLDDFEVFKIDGHVFEEGAWQRKGTLAQERKVEQNSKYELGRLVKYGTDIQEGVDYSNAFIEEESDFDKMFVSSKSGSLEISLDLAHPLPQQGLLILDLEFGPTNKSDREAEIKFSSGKSFGLRMPESDAPGRLVFSPTQIEKSKKRISFSVGILDKENNSTIRLSSLRLSQADLPLIDLFSSIKLSDNIQRFVPLGFAVANKIARWTNDTHASINFRASARLFDDAILTVDLARFAREVNPEKFTARINGFVLPRISPEKVIQNINGKLTFDLSRVPPTKTGFYKLEFITEVTSPFSLGDSTDRRTLGVYIRSISFDFPAE